jgi:hypothetical protein
MSGFSLFSRTLGLIGLIVASGGSAQAGGLLIWSPVKTAPGAYQTTLGFSLPLQWQTSAGADVGLATASGRIEPGSQMATLWGKLADDRNTFDGTTSREVSVRLDTVNNSGAFLLSDARSWIYSEDIGLGTSRSLSIGYAPRIADSTSISASQALTLTYPWTGTSVSASGALTDIKGALTTSLALEQPLAPNLNFTASLTDPMSTAQTGDVHLQYQVKW